MNKLRNINWYRFNRSLHRDVGYFCIGMVLVFAVSGIAVNHKDDWNPNYQVTHKLIQAPVTKWHETSDEILLSQIFNYIDEGLEVKATYWASPTEFKVFLKSDGNITLNLDNHQLIFEHIEARPVFQAINRLHLNETHKAWIVFSDLFAGLLIFLAISALFMVKGKYSPWGRRAILVTLGFIIPMGFIYW
ncbi:hypothetical protein CWB72_16810 [Pseudoalteromonas phenolica]|nr:hypothetical protein CWB72_16810 [Pseudoalteromonas phenolica]